MDSTTHPSLPPSLPLTESVQVHRTSNAKLVNLWLAVVYRVGKVVYRLSLPTTPFTLRASTFLRYVILCFNLWLCEPWLCVGTAIVTRDDGRLALED
ncbi:hypothetical protein HanPSC8_Chr17g0773381 [Helianthus annuus]|nr:hypothetical protein HanIR_Chr17g0874311 [Helianthus annuus]KAJ0813434.1 hypothetical protein HanPSC8_Chr17g0773381 [Helianthus annuus]